MDLHRVEVRAFPDETPSITEHLGEGAVVFD
jgi:hypothetical protein